jgi:hypothetical protein
MTESTTKGEMIKRDRLYNVALLLANLGAERQLLLDATRWGIDRF